MHAIKRVCEAGACSARSSGAHHDASFCTTIGHHRPQEEEHDAVASTLWDRRGTKAGTKSITCMRHCLLRPVLAKGQHPFPM